MAKQQTNDRKVALITGASKGLGLTLARFFAAQGYDLIITARDAEQLGAAQARLEQHGTHITGTAGDVSDPNHHQHLVEAVRHLQREPVHCAWGTVIKTPAATSRDSLTTCTFMTRH